MDTPTTSLARTRGVLPSRSTAERCADLLREAYATRAPRPWVCDAGADATTLVYPGTRSWADWRSDIDVEKRSLTGFDGNRVHEGWGHLTNRLYVDALGACQPLVDGGRVVITGHSLGAAVALLTAYQLARDLAHRHVQVEVVAFGCPRVGGSGFHAAYHDRVIPTLRIYCEHDPVAHIPGYWRWRHVGAWLHLTKNGDELRDPSSFWSRAAWWMGWEPWESIDHAMMGYDLALMAHDHKGHAWLA